MGNDVDAVIEALKVALDEARRNNEFWWKANSANRWINRLPGAWTGRWRDLKLQHGYQVERTEFIGHVRATIAYLETNREAIAAMPVWSWGRPAAKPLPPAEPIDAEFTDIPPDDPPKVSKGRKSLRVLK